MSNLALVTDNMLPVANETFIDNLSAGISAGAAIVPVNSLAEYSDGDSVVLTVDPGTASQATFIGEKQGNTVIDCKWTEGNVGASHAAGATVIDYDSATHYDVVTKLLRMFANENGTLKTTAVQAALNQSGAVPADYTTLATNPSAVTYLGQRQYQLTYPGVDYTDRLQKKTRLRVVRAVAAPNMSTLLNGTNQYWSMANPNKITFTNTFTYMGYVKPISSYAAATGAIISRDSAGSAGSGWEIALTNAGQISIFWRNGSGSSSFSTAKCMPLNRGFHLSVVVTAATNTVLVYIDGISVGVVSGGTAGSSIVQPVGGNLYLGQRSGTTAGFFSGIFAQFALFSTALTQNQILSYISQGFIGNEANLISAWSLSGATGMNDLNTTTPNNLTANGGATTTNAEAFWGVQGNGAFSTTVDYGIIARVTKPGADTIVLVTVPEGCTLATTGGVFTSYSTADIPFGFPSERRRWQIFVVQNTLWQPAANAVMQATNIEMDLPIGEWALRAKFTYDAEIPAGGSISEHLMGLGTAQGGAAFSLTTLEGSLFTLYDSSNVSNHRLMQAISIPPIDVTITTAVRYYVLCTKNAGITIMLRNMVAPAMFVADNTLL